MRFCPKSLIFLIYLMGSLLNSKVGHAQSTDEIKWINFNHLDDSLKNKPKKVFINFYADWCTYCHEMDKKTFSDKEVITVLNNDYYAVKMNIEIADTVFFGNQVFINERWNKRNPIHQIALMMASRKNKQFTLPAMVILDEKFVAQARYFQFLSATQLIKVLESY